MADRIRSYDWSKTELGAITTWPTELVVMVNQLLSSKLIGCIIWGEEKTLLYNDLYQPLLGNKKQALGQPFLEVWSEIREQASAIISPPLQRGDANIFDRVPFQILVDGQFVERICSLTNNPIWIETEDGPRIAGIYQTIVDHTEGEIATRQLKESEANLRQAHAELAAMYESGAVAAALIDAKTFQYVRVNARLAEMLQTTPQKLEGASVFELAEDVPELRAQLERVAAGVSMMNVTSEGVLNNQPGQRRSWQSNYVPVYSEIGEITGIAAASLETTAQRKAEAILIRNEKLAAVGRLAASIAHEINNPLESVTNLVYLARLTEDAAEVDNYLETAERELRRASAITNQTLRFYKQSTNSLGVTPHDLLDNVLALQQGRILNSRVMLELRERATEPIHCFDGEIRQVLNNLVTNAIDAMHARGGRLLVRSRTGTEWKTGERGVVLTIADTGTGIPKDVRSRLYEAFYTTKGMNGNGLGLWVSKEIIDRHHGVLRVRSSTAEGRSGTVFTVFLPFKSVAS